MFPDETPGLQYRHDLIDKVLEERRKNRRNDRESVHSTGAPPGSSPELLGKQTNAATAGITAPAQNLDLPRLSLTSR
ncbi:hypothetical protein F8M49_26420 [Rhodococcus zopfii]|uniref:Uncharacterized protein n=1 Tax=Rhodococcus zopfii TaxID=43772 RepID=A0ABU3WVL9_9NOCA|nr:hypothetical protein [Rhodococcus zopfii]